MFRGGSSKKDDDPPELEDLDSRDEMTRVVNHRYRVARRAGIDHPEAEELAYGDCDLEQLRRLAERGCEPAVIVRILS